MNKDSCWVHRPPWQLMMNQSEFWSKVVKTEYCWIWMGTKRLGYGIVPITRDGKRTTTGAHRLSYEWATGENPGKSFVMHSCDNPPCVRPEHLSLGTHAQNMDDMRAKQRQPGILTEKFVRDARLAAARGENIGMMALEAGYDKDTVLRAVRGQSWSHLDTPPVQEVVFHTRRKVVKLSHEQINEILKALEKPYWGQVNDLAKKYGVRHSMISHIKSGRFVPARFNS